MSTHVTTRNPVRSDVSASPETVSTSSVTSRRWALAGIGAGVTGVGTIVFSSMISAIYDPALVGDPAGIAAKLATQTGAMYAFHTATVISAVLLVVFGAGLHRRLRSQDRDSVAPLVALSGVLGTAVVMVMGSGLDTEFMMGVTEPDLIQDANAAMFNHWTGTIPWLWTLVGLAGLATFVVQRRGGLPRWLGLTGLVLGGLTVLLGISPAQYMAGATGPLWVLVASLGFFLGDKAFRRP